MSPAKHCEDHSGHEARLQAVENGIHEVRTDVRCLKQTLNRWGGAIVVIGPVIYLLISKLAGLVIPAAMAAIGG